MATEIGTAYLSIVASTRGLAKDIRKAYGDAEAGAGQSGQAAGGSWLSGMKGKILKAGAILGVGAVVGKTISLGMDRAVAIEGAQKKLEGLGHSASLITSIMGSALASVKGTTYGLGDAAKVAAGLSAAGVKNGEDLTKTLKTVADTAAISGRSLTDIGTIFGSVVARGRLQGDDMLQLMSSGVPVLQLLAKQTGKTSAEVSKMVSAGKIDFATFAAAMQAGMGGAALRTGETFEGAVANMKASMGRLGAAFLVPFTQLSKPLLNGVTALIDGVTSSVTPLAKALGEKLQPAADKLGKGMQELPKTFGRVKEAISGTKLGYVLGEIQGGIRAFAASFRAADGDITSAGFPGVMEQLGYKASQAVAKLQTVPDALRSLWAGLTLKNPLDLTAPFESMLTLGHKLRGGLSTAFEGAKKAVQGFVDGFGGIGNLVEAMRNILPLVTGPLGVLKSALASVFSGGSGIDFGGLGRALGSGLRPVLEGVAQLAATLSGALAGAIAQIVPIAIQLGGAFLSLAGTLVTQLAPVLGQVATQALPIFSNLISSLAPLIMSVVSALAPLVIQLVGQLAPVVTNLATALFPPLMSIIDTLAKSFISLAESLLPLATLIIGQLVPPIMTLIGVFTPLVGVLAEVVSMILAIVIPAITQFIGVITGILTPVIKGLLPVVSTIFGAIGGVIKTVLNVIQGVIRVFTGVIKGDWSQVWSGVRQIFSSIWSGIVGAAKGAMSALGGAISGGVKAVLGFFAGLPRQIIGAIGNAGTMLLDVGRQIIQGLINGIKGMMKGAIDAVKNGVKGLINGAKSLLGIASPSRVFKAIGRFTVQGLVVGVRAEESSVRAASEALTRAITPDLPPNPWEKTLLRIKDETRASDRIRTSPFLRHDPRIFEPVDPPGQGVIVNLNVDVEKVEDIMRLVRSSRDVSRSLRAAIPELAY